MKTLAIKLEDDVHAQLSVLAQLAGTSIAEELRLAVERHLEARRAEPELTARAEAVLADIEREATTRRGAIATLFGQAEPGNGPTGGGRRKARSGEEAATA